VSDVDNDIDIDIERRRSLRSRCASRGERSESPTVPSNPNTPAVRKPPTNPRPGRLPMSMSMSMSIWMSMSMSMSTSNA
jgi:hypothetical protein